MFDNVRQHGCSERKLYLGGRLRRLRRELGLNQSAMAAEIGISPSYLNHLERNQRPVTAQVLLRLAEAYDVDLRSFAAEGGDGTGVDQLAEIFADPMFADIGIPRYELLEVADNAPAVADAIVAPLRRLGRAAAASGRRRRPTRRCAGHARGLGARLYPGPAQPLPRSRGGGGDAGRSARRSADHLRARSGGGCKEGFGVDTRVVPPELLDPTSQHYDCHRKRLMLSALLRPESRTFGVAYQLALLEFGPMLDAMVETRRRRPTRRPGGCCTCASPIMPPARS